MTDQNNNGFVFFDAKKARTTSLLPITILFAISLAILLGNALILYRNMGLLKDHEHLVKHTQEVISELDILFSAIKDAETGERGFIISGEEPYLEPYNRARRDTAVHLERLKDFITDSPKQQENAAKLGTMVEEMFDRFEVIIDMRRKQGTEVARAAVLTGTGKAMMDEIRQTISSMRRAERQLLEQRSKEADEASVAVDRALAIETFAIILILCIAYYFVRRYLLQQNAERIRLERESWLKNGLAELSDILRGNLAVHSLCKKTLTFFARYLNVPVGTFYVMQDNRLHLEGTFATHGSLEAAANIEIHQGALGEAVAEKRLVCLRDLPDSYLKVSSSLGETHVKHTVAIPVLLEDEVKGVIELGSLEDFQDLHFELFEFVRDSLGVTLEAAQSRKKMQDLLEETQSQAEELAAQQEELRASNEELEAQTSALKFSQERLQMQQEELRQTNEELSQQAAVLESQKADLSAKNQALKLAQSEVEAKARDLAQASRYKSEFLANMSHELRTPLNSLLILATLLYENNEGNLNEKQINFAKTIHRSGSDLLNLINDILDLAKVESGKLEINIEDVEIELVCFDLEQAFKHLAEQKNIAFNTAIETGVPTSIRSDKQRLEQILKNFLSNAIKFTEHGSVGLHFKLPDHDDHESALQIDVVDTGIGIPEDKQSLIFEAFQQADGSTSREYGGTGLGLTISRELAQLLRCQINISSAAGVGSTFSLLVPKIIKSTAEAPATTTSTPVNSASNLDQEAQARSAVTVSWRPHAAANATEERREQPKIVGDTEGLTASDRLVLIIEDDEDFGEVILSQAREAGFKAILTTDGAAGLELLEKHKVHGVILDLRLPDVSGLSILERLKASPKTRHIPIHIVSGTDQSRNALKMGAIGYLMKPVSLDQLSSAFARIEDTLAKKIKNVLIIEDDDRQRDAMCELLGGSDIEIDAVGLGKEAIDMLAIKSYDCMILDLRLPDISGFELLEHLGNRDASSPPVVVYTGKELTADEFAKLRKYSKTIIIKGAKSPERLLDEVSLFLHRVEAQLPPSKQALLQNLRDKEKIFEDRQILLVDDDMRNVFALANALEIKGVKITVAKNGVEALNALNENPQFDLVLMDIMMPLMDGFEAMEKIRLDARFKKMPIIALTAKAMKGDQEKCLKMGANDYLPKPVNLEKLLSLLRVWMPPRSSEL